jgi:alcohol dehydrogenase YqhD (iron-dependent ADH family)
MGGGLQVVVGDVEEFVEDVAVELVDSVLGDVVVDMTKKVACEVCFEDDVPDVWELRRRGSA